MNFDLSEFEQKQLYIFGLGKEGFSTYQFLRKHLPEKKIILVDDQSIGKLQNHWRQAGDSPYSSLTTSDSLQFSTLSSALSEAVVFKTPGIPSSHELIEKATKAGAVISSNTNLFFQLLEQIQASGQKLTTIGVTGTKGKSTTAAAIHHVLKSGGRNVALGGNIGVPPLDLLGGETEEIAQIIVLELSSHQLNDLRYSPNFAVVLEITPEHLDYYPDFSTYAEAKSQIVRFQRPEDYVVFNPLFEYPAQFARLSAGKKLPFGSQTAEFAKPASYIEQNAIYSGEDEIIDLAELPVKGSHNYLNLLSAVVIAKQLGLGATEIRQALQSFKPLEHRLEEIGPFGGVLFVNDSLSTTPESAIAALRSYSGKEIILIAGGYDRQQNFSNLAKDISEQKVKALIFFEPTGLRLAKEIEKFSNTSEVIIEKAETMDEAVQKAVGLAAENSVVLMSPASASFGRFRDYQDRGNQFKAAVQNLPAGKLFLLFLIIFY